MQYTWIISSYSTPKNHSLSTTFLIEINDQDQDPDPDQNPDQDPDQNEMDPQNYK